MSKKMKTKKSYKVSMKLLGSIPETMRVMSPTELLSLTIYKFLWIVQKLKTVFYHTNLILMNIKYPKMMKIYKNSKTLFKWMAKRQIKKLLSHSYKKWRGNTKKEPDKNSKSKKVKIV